MANFLEQYLSPAGKIGGHAWTEGTKTHSPKQVKVAIQQLLNLGYGINNAPDQFFEGGGPMKGVPGMYSTNNPLGKYQGPGGNLGSTYYGQAKAAGFDSWILDENTCVWKAPIDVPDDASTTVFYEWNESAYQADNTKGWEKITDKPL